MKIKLGPIIFLLAFALLIQNTCPFGAAGKTSVAPTCGHCPLKHCRLASPEGQKDLVTRNLTIHFPMFVFAVPKTIHTFRLEPIMSATPLFASSYVDALPDELLRPPRA